LSILIRGCALLDERKPDGYASNSSVLIEGNRISQVTSAPISEHGVETIIDGRDTLAIPGLINAHTHSPENRHHTNADCSFWMPEERKQSHWNRTSTGGCSAIGKEVSRE